MGFIREDIVQVFLPQYPEQATMLKPFLFGFDVTYADRKEFNNTILFVYVLKPEGYIKDSFGISKEILLTYSPFSELQPRAIQATNRLFSMFPFQNRIDTLNCFFVSEDISVLNYKGVTTFYEGCSRVFVPMIYDDLIANCNDTWYIRNILKKNFFDIDLFGYTLPLKDETSFFGRQDIVARYIDAIRRCENRGIFGVRKTGKTSLLFKIDRVIRDQNLGFVFFYDCKSPSYRKMHWNELLGSICDNIAKRLNITIRREYDEYNIIKSFRYMMKEASLRNKKVIIMFDEIEYISFKSPMDTHWEKEFIDFWQTIWSVQSLHRNLVFILSGVNPSVTEVDTINGVQNPLFGIVQSEYLQGLSQEDTHNMVRILGKRMGMRFTYDAIEFLYCQYNGHPMLTRLASSYINRQYDTVSRPIDIGLNDVTKIQSDIDTELAYYFRHVVSEIQQFYPEEYEMFELLASGQTSDFIELAKLSEYTKHLYSYGLIVKDGFGIPCIRMPVAGRYVAMELAKKENRRNLYKIVDPTKRDIWVSQRIKSIIRDLRMLETAIHAAGLPKLFGENSFPEAEKFAMLSRAENRAEFDNFFNICNRCFIEAIENYGKSIGKEKYFWNEMKTIYPSLWAILHRIKIYRHSVDHLKLNPNISRQYQILWCEDTEGVTDENEKYFCIQQRILEGLIVSIQVELGNIS